MAAAPVAVRKLPAEEQRAWERGYYARNRKKLLQKAKDWQAANPDYVSRWRRANAERHKDNLRRQRYGISGNDYRTMLALQGGLCAICRRLMAPPHVDHDHISGRVRGLLCDNCNRGIGHLQEDTGVLASAMAYLKKEMD